MQTPKPLVLTILDGWGHREEADHNAVQRAKTPHFDMLWKHYPHGVINASELHVGLPHGQMGNSEVGHMNIGSGRVVMQDLPRIDQAIVSGSLALDTTLLRFIEKVKASSGQVHLMGLMSDGGVHSHQHHIATLANILASHDVTVQVHAFLDGRDTPPKSALGYLDQFERDIKNNPLIRMATVSGRYYAMDRDKRWERVKLAFDALTQGYGQHFKDWKNAIESSYSNNVTDEFVLPSVLDSYRGMKAGDGILMTNFRADRARELLDALLDPDFSGFARAQKIAFSACLGMTEYSSKHSAWMQALFPPEPLTHIFGEVIANAGLKQLRIAETEKYPHVTFFFNGGREEVFAGEDRIIVPSPKVATYDLKPEMSAYEVTEKLVAAIASDIYDVVIVNYANTDMVGHTGDLEAATRAVETVDECLGKLWGEIEKKGGALVITADHGNAEMMMDHDTHQAHTAHTLNLVPLIIASPPLKGESWNIPEGKLADIAPTLLDLLGLPIPAEMNGCSVIPESLRVAKRA
jgi:2,3-bisphosphoglycerate-independent phosphoglycerate mutase